MLSDLTGIKPPNSHCPFLLGDEEGQGHLHLLVYVQPLDNPKSRVFPHMTLQRDASPWEYDSHIAVQNQSFPSATSPCIC